MKKLLKIGIVLLILIITCSNLIVFGIDIKSTFDGTIDGELSSTADSTRQVLGTILNVIRVIGMAIALIILTYIGIKFMIASPSERANIKQYSMNYVIGAFILIGGVGILTIIRDYAVKIGE